MLLKRFGTAFYFHKRSIYNLLDHRPIYRPHTRIQTDLGTTAEFGDSVEAKSQVKVIEAAHLADCVTGVRKGTQTIVKTNSLC